VMVAEHLSNAIADASDVQVRVRHRDVEQPV
jgi:RNase adaptor protein for sRNA GlmZ degradation